MMQKGFTLLEILIVIVIIMVMSSVAILNIGTVSYSGFLAEANKLANTFEIISDEAVYTDSVIICEPNPEGLACKIFKKGEWKDLQISRLVSWGWPKKIQISQVVVNGVTLKSDEKIRFFAHGDNTRMSFQISDGVHTTWIDGDLSGNFRVSN